MVINFASRLRHPVSRQLYKMAAPIVERGLAIRDFNDLYERTRRSYAEHEESPSAHAWFATALQELGVDYEVDLPTGIEIPKEGPLVVLSNHPFGLLDPVILGDMISRYRPQVRFMTNYLLEGMEEMRPWIIPVDPFAGEGSTRRNLAPMKEALRFLKGGGALAVFPSGEVAHYQLGKGVQESPWSGHVGALARRAGATVVPVYFEGRNSLMFQTAGLLHPKLRTGLLLRELFHRHEKFIRVHVGHPVVPARFRHFEDDQKLTQYLRLSTILLSRREKQEALRSAVSEVEPVKAVLVAKQANAIIALAGEVESLRQQGGLLCKQGPLEAYVASAASIPLLLNEIGRLREVTFRHVGEGTGKEIDLDKFDSYYLHVFLWDEQHGRVAGAYRLGQCDQILRSKGARGLYTNTLFKFRPAFVGQLENALEMGRSFIVHEYQRHLSALPLLWKAISKWVAQHPQYHKLFGPVSISQDYHGLSRELMVRFLRDNCLHPALAREVQARQPFHFGKSNTVHREFVSSGLNNVEAFSTLIANLEEDGKGLPTLLKHYLRLNGTLLSFNVDKAFSSCLDGLILVDLLETDPKLLAKYMGEEACAAYLEKHRNKQDSKEPAYTVPPLP